MSVSIFGRGPAYPFRKDPTRSRALIVSEEENVMSCIRHIIKTPMYSRPFTVKNGIMFGTRIRRALFESEKTAEAIAVYDVRNALDIWEPRIVVQNVVANWAPAHIGKKRVLLVTVFFTYRKTNRADNLVVPFYQGDLREAA